jgi:ferredoxin
MALATVATLKQLSHLPVCGCGGVQKAEDVLEFLMLGAGAVEIASVILREGYGVIETMLRDLNRWLDDHQYDGVDNVVGLALDTISPFEEVAPGQLTARLAGECDGCGICVPACIYDALVCETGTVSFVPGKCTGCGMCVELCPRKALQLGW